MSLNGLDDVKVKEAHDAANSEPSGWFLLKYLSRDEIDILDTGNGGITDIRSAIARYEEPSPLYGFLRYRRRSVIIKYIPEDCSRLLQARAAVHFNAICDQFPHNTTFEISDAKDLKDSKLSAACSLHAASGSSSSSSSSLRRRRLNEIAEEEEEEERERKRQSVVNEEARPASSIYSDSPASPSPEPPVVLDRQQITNPSETNFASTKNIPDFAGADVPASPTKSDFGRRLSSQSARHEVYSSSSYYQGRKVKLGPRPSIDAHKRPSTAENFRPVATLPTGFKFFKGSKKDKAKEGGQNERAGYLLPATAPTPGLLPQSMDDQLPPRPATSSGASIKSTTPSMAPTREGKLTPEKARLMKAMRLREKKLQDAKSEVLSTTKYKSSVDSVADPVPNTEPQTFLSVQPDYSTSTLITTFAAGSPTSATTRPESHSRDIALESHPSSPAASSSTCIGDSTKASSLSDLTDETIQPDKESAQDTDEVREGVAETPDIMKGTDLQRSALGIQRNSTTKLVDTAQSETIGANGPSNKFAKNSEEFAQIPGSNTNNSQQTGGMIRKSIEPNDFALDANFITTLHDGKSLDEAQTYELSADLRESDKITPDTTVLPEVRNQPGIGFDDKHSASNFKGQLGIPQSKFAPGEAKSPTSPTSPTTPNLKSRFSRKPITASVGSTLPAVNEPVRTLLAAKYEPPKPDVPLKTGPEILLASPPKPPKQKAIVDPICTDLPAKGVSQPDLSDPLDDDALMDELQTATVQEAKPMLVSKSPITPVFPNASSPPRKDGRLPRAASNPMRASLLMPVDLSQANAPRSVSGGAVFLNSLSRNPSNASIQSKKGNVGSSISQRIKALEALSGNPNEDRPRPTTPSSTFFTVRKQATRDPSKSPSVVERANTMTHNSPTPEGSREPTPEAPNSMRERSGSVASRLTMFEGQNAPRGRPDSIQVTARIIRGATSPFTNLTNTSKKVGDAAPAEFRQSTLLVDVHRAQSAKPQALSDRPPLVERPKTSVSEVQVHQLSASEIADKQARRRSSLSLMKNFIKEHTPLSNKSTDILGAISPRATPLKSPSQPPSSHQGSSSFVRRLSTSSRRSSFNHEGDNASISGATRSSSRVSDNGSTEDDMSLSDKKSKNRTSRFMRRLSNSFGGARKSGSASISPTVTEEDADQLEKAPILAQQQVTSPTIVAFMGDVNVQFPDNLLWKRRSMCLDAQGMLFLSAIQGGTKKGKDSVGTKRFHMGDFRKPYIPDVEIQELPNSVLLDFLEGSSLQIACGDRVEQQNILRTLQEAHQTHAAGRH